MRCGNALLFRRGIHDLKQEETYEEHVMGGGGVAIGPAEGGMHLPFGGEQSGDDFEPHGRDVCTPKNITSSPSLYPLQSALARRANAANLKTF